MRGARLPDTVHQPPANDFSISVAVPVHHGGPRFKRCLDHLAKAVPAPREIIVVADGDTEESGVLAERFGARAIRLPERGGPARARNAGAQEATGDILFFVDAEVAVHPDIVAQVAEAFRNAPDLTAVFGSYDDAPPEPNFLSQYKNLLHHYVHQSGQSGLNLRISGRLSVVFSYGLLLSLMSAAWRPVALWGAAACLGTVLALNAPLYHFFARKRGAGFALKSIPWHIFYFLYDGAAFAMVALVPLRARDAGACRRERREGRPRRPEARPGSR
jgi:glycosyltransferase involved in cell wall biosynthesis